MRLNIFRRGPAPRKPVSPLTMATRIEDPARIRHVQLGLDAITKGVEDVIDYIELIDAYMDQLKATRDTLVAALDSNCRVGAIPARTHGVLRAWSAQDDPIEQRASSTPAGSQSRVVSAAHTIKS